MNIFGAESQKHLNNIQEYIRRIMRILEYIRLFGAYLTCFFILL